MRLDKYISTLTDLSRKDVKAALKYGRISVDGVPARDPAMQVDERTATVTLDGAALMFKRHTHIMMNKPAGVLTATEDRAQKTVLDILPDSLRPRDLGLIGRLDKDTTGLLLLSTDGQLAHRLYRRAIMLTRSIWRAWTACWTRAILRHLRQASS